MPITACIRARRATNNLATGYRLTTELLDCLAATESGAESDSRTSGADLGYRRASRLST